MYCLSQFCCVCLSNSKELLKLTNVDKDEVPLLFKMIDVVYGHEEIDLKIVHLYVCTECLKIMRSAFKLKRVWIKNTNIVKNYIGQLKSHTGFIGSYGEATVVLTDLNEKVVKNDMKFEDLNLEANNLQQAEIIDVKEDSFPETNLPNVSASASKTKSSNCANVNVLVISCYICSEEFFDHYNYKKHLSSKHGIIQFDCIICNQKYSTESNYRMHLQIHQNLTFYDCPVCKKSYPRKDYLELHIKYHDKRYTLNEKTGKYCCQTCQFNFKYQWNLNEHECENFMHMCDICGKTLRENNRHCHVTFDDNKSQPSYAMDSRPFQGNNYIEPSSSFTFTQNVQSQPGQMTNNVNVHPIFNRQQIVTEQLSKTNSNIQQQEIATTNSTEANLNNQSRQQITYDLSKTTPLPTSTIVNNTESIVRDKFPIAHSAICPICNLVCLTQADYDIHVHTHCRAETRPSQ